MHLKFSKAVHSCTNELKIPDKAIALTPPDAHKIPPLNVSVNYFAN